MTIKKQKLIKEKKKCKWHLNKVKGKSQTLTLTLFRGKLMNDADESH